MGLLYVTVTAAVTAFDLVTASPIAMPFLPGRLFGIVLVLMCLRASREAAVRRRGQIVMCGFFVALNAGLYLSVQTYGDYVLALVPAFMTALAMTLVLQVLLYRFALPIAAVALVAYADRMVMLMPGLTFVIPVFFLAATALVLACGAYVSERGKRAAWAATRVLSRQRALAARAG